MHNSTDTGSFLGLGGSFQGPPEGEATYAYEPTLMC